MHHKWTVIDCFYRFPQFAASFLCVKNNRAILIENNTNRAIPFLLEAFRNQGVKAENVDYLIVTHAHLDHSGATAALTEIFPNAKVLAHPKAARTLTAPERLVASAKKVYGEKEFLELYGEVMPVAKDRVIEMKDGEVLAWENTRFRFLFTEGHATHHFCVLDESDQSVFTGDAFGLSYPNLKGSRIFHIPSTSPVDFNYEEAVKAVDQIVATGAKKAYLTHFGSVCDIPERAQLLKRHLEAHEKFILECNEKKISDSEVEGFLLRKVSEYIEKELRETGVPLTEGNWALLKMDIELNAAGLAVACLKRRQLAPC